MGREEGRFLNMPELKESLDLGSMTVNYHWYAEWTSGLEMDQSRSQDLEAPLNIVAC